MNGIEVTMTWLLLNLVPHPLRSRWLFHRRIRLRGEWVDSCTYVESFPTIVKWFLLHRVPRRLRSRWPFKRFFWQPNQVAAIRAEAKRMYEKMKPYID